jgi:hypothetical protein
MNMENPGAFRPKELQIKGKEVQVGDLEVGDQIQDLEKFTRITSIIREPTGEYMILTENGNRRVLDSSDMVYVLSV